MRRIPQRIQMAIVVFFVLYSRYITRRNAFILFSLLVDPPIYKAQPTCTNNSSSVNYIQMEEDLRLELKKYYKWSKAWNDNVSLAYNIAYICGNIVFGIVCDRFGPRRIIFGTLILAGITTVVTPVLAKVDPLAVLVLRIVGGFSLGALFPGLQTLYVKWVPPHERGRINLSFFGGTVSSATAFPLTKYLGVTIGIDSTFYIGGAFLFLVSFIFLIVVYDTPVDHPRITQEEIQYLQENIPYNIEKKKKFPPLKKILTSKPVYGYIIMSFGICWGVLFYILDILTYYADLFGSNLNLRLEPIFGLMNFLSGIIFGWIGDIAYRKLKKPLLFQRKMFVCFSNILPGGILIFLFLAGCDIYKFMVIICLGLVFIGSMCMTTYINAIELSPNYAGTIFGIGNSLGLTGNIINKYIVQALIQDDNALHEWRIVYCINSLVYFATGIGFILMGSVETQQWNNDQDDPVEANASK